MADRTYVYIDGESHYIRSQEAWRAIHGTDACLEHLRYTNPPDEQLILVIPKAKVFWTRKFNPGVDRAVYFTGVACDESALHHIKVKLRNFDLEPHVVPERKDRAAQRENVRNTQRYIEKPKGVDIALAVRMLHDAYYNAFQACHLYTSDVDFLPAIREVRAVGKRVFVHGYKNGLSRESELLHVPDQFTDLEETLRADCRMLPSAEAPLR
ncbi:hypothetical protein LCGC14_1787020 [marine sediment metagenome]|uniref:NYN domain-containing protein n=1 Tax=marine sediment metagenome TaxID=412755 RepID=A0A0F9JTB9_9ZZZZ